MLTSGTVCTALCTALCTAFSAAGNRVMAFKRVLDAAGIPTSVRITRGLEADAACGQLRNRNQKEPLQAFSVPS